MPDGGNPDLLRRLKKFQDKGEISATVDLVAICFLLQIETLGLGVTVSLQANLKQDFLEERLKAFAAVIALGLQSSGSKNL
ncbi:hypothetical protein [Leptospira sp. 'Mane']|uniref:hypothetical protein n=1 Tax=Leptospira sp. 'Mane' TaxID=3387407 RepID=UPI00398BB3FE